MPALKVTASEPEGAVHLAVTSDLDALLTCVMQLDDSNCAEVMVVTVPDVAWMVKPSNELVTPCSVK